MTAKTRADFKTAQATAFADNTSGDITAVALRAQMDDLADSALFPGDAGTEGPQGPAGADGADGAEHAYCMISDNGHVGGLVV